MNSHWISVMFGKFLLMLCLFQLVIITFVLFKLYINNLKNESGYETDINSGNESDYEDEIPKDKKNKIMPGARLRMMRR